MNYARYTGKRRGSAHVFVSERDYCTTAFGTDKG